MASDRVVARDLLRWLRTWRVTAVYVAAVAVSFVGLCIVDGWP